MNSSNRLRRSAFADCQGKEIFEIHPVILGGSPTDPANKAVLSREEHIKAVVYWNKVIAGVSPVEESQPRPEISIQPVPRGPAIERIFSMEKSSASDMHRFLLSLNRRPHPSDALIESTRNQLGGKLPEEYIAFLKVTDGGEGFIGK